MPNDLYEPKYWSLKDVLNQRYQIPVYQRPYSWSNDEVETLLEDLWAAFESCKAAGTQANQGLFTGTLYLRRAGSAANGACQLYDVIDGQQRLSTISMILIALFSMALNEGLTDSSPTLVELKRGLWKTIHQQFVQEERLLTLGNVDRTIFTNLFDEAFANPKAVLEYVKAFKTTNPIEKNLLEMFRKICRKLEGQLVKTDSDPYPAATYLDFLLNCVQFIAIICNTSMSQVFGMFESINSKGKDLELIDLIKTYIFSKIPETDYYMYLTRWGSLIEKTNDNLEDYLHVFVQSKFKFYGQRMSMLNFRSLAKHEFQSYYGVQTEGDALKELLNDMAVNCDYYEYLLPSGVEKAVNYVNKDQFELFFTMSQNLNYSFSKPLLFRAFQEKAAGLLTASEVADVTKYATLFQFQFMSLGRGASNRTVDIWHDVMRDIYDNNRIIPANIKKIFAEGLLTLGVTPESIASNAGTLNYTKNHAICYSFLSLVESIVNQDNGKSRLNASQALVLLKAYGKDYFEIDHMLPQDPKRDDEKLKYYKDDSNGTLKLKDGHDFPAVVFDGMGYDEFEARTIDLLGNLQIINKVGNILMSNQPITLPNHEDFTTYKQITERMDILVKTFLACEDFL